MGKSQDVALAAIAYDKDKINDWVDMLKESETYKDQGFWKRFRKDSALEMFNPWVGGAYGIFEEWVSEETLQEFLRTNSNIPLIE